MEATSMSNDTLDLEPTMDESSISCILESPDLPVLNLTDPDIAVLYEYDAGQSALVAVVYPCICLLGLLTNSVFLLTVIRVPYMRTLINVYLTNLAISDIMFLCTGSGFGLWKYLSTPVTADFSILGGSVGCMVAQTSNVTPFLASMLLVTVVTVERYLAVCHPIRHRNINTRGRALVMTSLAWVVALVVGAAGIVPSTMVYVQSCVIWPKGKYYAEFPDLIANCRPLNGIWVQILALVTLTVPWFVTFVITFILYLLIVRKLTRRFRNGPSNERSDRRVKSRQARDHVAKMLMIAGTVFFALLTPRVIVTLYYYIIVFAGAPPIPQDTQFIIFTSTNVLLYVNSVVNPILYAFSNERYRKAIFDMWRGSRATLHSVVT